MKPTAITHYALFLARLAHIRLKTAKRLAKSEARQWRTVTAKAD